MKKYIFDLIVALYGFSLIFEGLGNEFESPTIFDYIKWFFYLIFLITYIIYKIRGVDKHGIRSTKKGI